jgi:hypothetical protein
LPQTAAPHIRSQTKDGVTVHHHHSMQWQLADENGGTSMTSDPETAACKGPTPTTHARRSSQAQGVARNMWADSWGKGAEAAGTTAWPALACGWQHQPCSTTFQVYNCHACPLRRTIESAGAAHPWLLPATPGPPATPATRMAVERPGPMPGGCTAQRH